MKVIFIVIMILTFPVIYGQDGYVSMVNDTVDYESTRMYIMVPEVSMKMSNEISDDEGFWIGYSIPAEYGKPGIMVIDYSVMNRNSLRFTKDYDVELWNTFDGDSVGSRCFMKDGLFYRIDRYEDGLEVFYSDVNTDMVEVVNEAMKSIHRKPKNESDHPLTVGRHRRIQ